MNDYISRDDALLHSKIIRVYSKDYGNIDVVPVEYLADIPAADVQPVKKTEFQIGYEQGFKDGRASAALPNTIDNGDKIDGYTYVYKTDSRGEPYIHIDSVRDMLAKTAKPVKCGWWVERAYDRKQCTYCGKCEDIATDFCPNCGARMDGDKE